MRVAGFGPVGAGSSGGGLAVRTGTLLLDALTVTAGARVTTTS